MGRSRLAAISGDDFYASPFGAVYSAYMERPAIGRMVARAVWGGDTGAYYERMRAIADVPAGGTIVDCPCGAGPALRALSPGSEVRYVAVDLSPAMLRRARRRASARGLVSVEFVEADASDIPLPPETADLFLSFWGLHCFDDPREALNEIARVTKPGGRVVGAALLRGSHNLRQRLLIRPGVGDFGRVATREELRSWLGGAGIELAGEELSGPLWFFEGVLPA